MDYLDRFTLYDVFLVAVGLAVASIIRIFYDSYKEKQRLKKLDELVSIYSKSMNSYSEGVIVIANGKDVLFANKEACRILGTVGNRPNISYLKNIVKIIVGDSGDEKRFLPVLEDSVSIADATIVVGDKQLPVEVSSNKFSSSERDGDTKVWQVIVIRDATSKLAMKEKLESAGLSIDTLTGFPLRHQLSGKLLSVTIKATQNSSMAALLMIRLERYHYLQAIYGVTKTDNILKSISVALSREAKESEAIYRFDNDTLAIVLDHIENRQEATGRLESFNKAVRDVLDANSIKHGTKSVAYCIQKPYPSYEKIVDACMVMLSNDTTETKAQSYISSTTVKLSRDDFRSSIENNDFFCFYQPIFELKKDKLVGIEVLVRLNYKKEGILLPNEFLAQAMEQGVMPEVTEHILDMVLSQKRFWSDHMGVDLQTTINLSMTDIHSGVFAEMLEKKMLHYGIVPDTVTIDISEDMLEQDFKAVYEECFVLNKLGVKLSIDHFGRGSVALKYLSDLPLSYIKIDGELIDDMLEREDKIRLVSGIISLGRKLGLGVGATFVDSSALKVMLARVGCNFAQGNYMGKPVPAFEITDILRDKTQIEK